MTASLCRWLWNVLNFVQAALKNGIFIMYIVFMVVLLNQWYRGTTQPTAAVKPGALLVDLSGNIADDVPLSSKHRGWLGRWIATSPITDNSLFEVVNAIRHAKDDSTITGMVMSLQNFGHANQPALRYIGKALGEFRASGKPIYAIGNSYSQSQYYLASFADNITLAPKGSVHLYGFSNQRVYYKSLLDKLKVTAHVFCVGAYKSAPEPFLRDDMSPEVRTADQHRLTVRWQHYIADIAENRQLPMAILSPDSSLYIDKLRRLKGDGAQYALQNRLVDKLATASETNEALVTIFGKKDKSDAFNAVSIYDYASMVAHRKRHETWHLPRIAVIVANGQLIGGVSRPGFVGSETTVRLLRQACYDKEIKAVVVHINSPGGIVTASEDIHDQLAAIKRAGKPIVVSMGGVAASGGYWVASAADHIVASSTTLTGSIGVFGVVKTYEKTLAHIGVHTDGVATSPMVDASISKPLPSSLSQFLQISVEKNYRDFIELVATARRKTFAEVDAIAQGRVWLGVDAYQNGLVDQLGDFDDAVAKATELAKLEKYHLHWLVPQPSTWLEHLTGVESARLINAVPTQLSTPLLQTVVERSLPQLMNYFVDPLGIFAFCDDCQSHYIH